MSDVQRICPHCGGDTPLNAQHCPQCGEDTLSPPAERRPLPVSVGQAMLPVAMSVAGFALRAGWKLIQSRLAQDAAKAAIQSAAQSAKQRAQPPAKQTSAAPDRPKRTVRIRSAWSVGDGRGNWQHGREEHVIEYDD